MFVSKAQATLARLLPLLVALFWFATTPLAALGQCDLYVQVQESLGDGAAALDVASYGSCDKPQTSAYAQISLPDGTHSTGSGSGTSYAEAYTSIATNGEAGQGSFSGDGDAWDQCWDASDNYVSFNDPFMLNNNTPVISGISPGTWIAGQTTSNVTITGQYFGTNAPALTFSPGTGISYSLSSYNDSQIVADITVASGTPDEDVTIAVTNNGYGGMGFQSGGGTVSPTSQSVYANVRSVPPIFRQVTIIAWVNGQAPDLVTLPTGANSTLITNLNSSGFSCAKEVGFWSIALKPVDLSSQNDRDYANAFLVAHSPNATPPSTISDPTTVREGGNYRLFNTFGSSYNASPNAGMTPNPCAWGNAVIPDWVAAGQASQYMNKFGTSSSGKLYLIAEGRIGRLGQRGSETINQGRTVPWIYDVIEFDMNGNITVSDHATFPTYYVYIDGYLHTELTSNQSTVRAFVYGYDASNEMGWNPIP